MRDDEVGIEEVDNGLEEEEEEEEDLEQQEKLADRLGEPQFDCDQPVLDATKSEYVCLFLHPSPSRNND